MLQFLKHPVMRPLTAAVLSVGALAAASPSWATTAADTTIRNTVTVNYADAASTAQLPITAMVDVTVNLVRSSPLLNAPADQSTDSATNAVYSYTLTSTANGIATYNLTTPLSQSAGISASTATASVGSVTLGATSVATAVTIAAAGTTAITVPSDNTSDASINGLVVNDLIIISGQQFQISAIGADAASPGTTTITVNGNGTLLNAPAGTLVAERQLFTMTVNPGPVSVAGVDQTVTVTTTATDSVDSAKTSNDVTITTVRNVNLTVQKLVRNANYAAGVGGNAAGAGAVVYNGNTYYTGGVTGNPTEVLEYMIMVSNAAGGADATRVLVSDPIPPFTTYVPNSMLLSNSAAAPAALNDSGADGDAGEASGASVYFYPGAGGTDGPGAGVNDGTGGTIVPAAVSHALFQITIN